VEEIEGTGVDTEFTAFASVLIDGNSSFHKGKDLS
jgi:hypothetical protein